MRGMRGASGAARLALAALVEIQAGSVSGSV
jgi:hypothetical protein